ncbi:transposase [Candidatus Tisiphia endosymbiont of Beris chalybata]|uniref:transposase n=1 Tax=Candidatus Tisiphia endosymbiont of Beris chalybata TaxID=3066262 RepID=UPI00312C9817
MAIAVDSTGLSLYTHTEWNRKKHQQNQLAGYEKWRKLHVAINVATGEILESRYTKSTANDGAELSSLLDSIPEEISAVCGDMAYDTVNCRAAIKLKKARQLIPPIRHARIAKDNRNIKKKYHEILYERDEAIRYIQYNTINGDTSLACKSWEEKSGYHARSLVETTMWQIKSHSSDYLSNKSEQARMTQARIKCKIVNLVNAA